MQNTFFQHISCLLPLSRVSRFKGKDLPVMLLHPFSFFNFICIVYILSPVLISELLLCNKPSEAHRLKPSDELVGAGEWFCFLGPGGGGWPHVVGTLAEEAGSVTPHGLLSSWRLTQASSLSQQQGRASPSVHALFYPPLLLLLLHAAKSRSKASHTAKPRFGEWEERFHLPPDGRWEERRSCKLCVCLFQYAIFNFLKLFYCCSITVVCIFSPPLPPPPSKPTSLPCFHPLPWFYLYVLYSSS